MSQATPFSGAFVFGAAFGGACQEYEEAEEAAEGALPVVAWGRRIVVQRIAHLVFRIS